ncbi:MAG TPA: hypothetical protein VHY20_06560, partial [Pirellulales bacterium]|nr:hypothetical protein [Pirellulales bacterium]
MRGRVSVAGGLAAWLALVAVALAQPPGDLRVARLIKQLGADSYADRSDASGELEKLGPAAREQLTTAAADPDPEVRLHAKDLLTRLKLRDLWA